MPLIVSGTTIEHLVFKAPGVNQEVDRLVVGGSTVFESTVYVDKPTISGAFTFDNTTKTPTVTGYNTSAMTQSGTTSATAAGTYTITYTPKAGYAWTDGSTDPYSLTWSIAKRSVTVPTISNTYKTYNGSAQSPTIAGVNSTYVTQSGTASATNAGSYTVTWALVYPASTQWSDGTTADKDGSWSIGKRSVTIPSLSGTTSFAYVQGASHSVSVTNPDSAYINQSGNTSVTDGADPAMQTVTWALKDTSNTQWTDGTVSTKSATWGTVWVNGTSHYSNDVYNRGWGIGNLEFNAGVTFNKNGEYITVGAGSGGGAHILMTYDSNGTFHADVYIAKGSGSIVETNGSGQYTGYGWNSGTGYTSTKDAWTEIYGAHQSTRPRFGLHLGNAINDVNGSRVRRIWIT